MTCLALPQVILGPTSFGVGPDAKLIGQRQLQIARHALATPTGATVLSRVLAVIDATENASQPDWDGHGARPANSDAVTYAMRFLAAYPVELPTPDVGVDPDGDVSLEWYTSSDYVFSISVSPSGELHYAGRFGRSTVRGKEGLTSHAFSRLLRSYISRVFAGIGS